MTRRSSTRLTRRGLRRGLLGGVMAGVLAAVSLHLGACNTPFIPIPPPGDPSFSPVVTTDAMGAQHTVWETSGGVNYAMANARVYVFNRALGEGVIARATADGTYLAPPLEGKLGDAIELGYETPKGERSAVICRALQDGQAHSSCP
jgi:hypothetical protein